ncbi:hypothetical protein RVIR1_07090 [Candidatus Rickettsiella viridis]|uniref:Uncharacterized protein n=1 Tax=Candidatus Rickettsiella viridis TaxID=676208 RepID=A0A2Z5UUP7_9COXI|nr:hypothetical protein [Candidatus Rickettsiella viridis]BBB15204.1 hypothetical protein RVIR1_07090 [Candidatus Rickettsiella viridis]
MHVLRQITLLMVLAFSVSPAFAFNNDASCCDQLRKEVQVLREQQARMTSEFKTQEVSEQKNFLSVGGMIGGLIKVLSNQFPNMKGPLDAIKNIADALGK